MPLATRRQVLLATALVVLVVGVAAFGIVSAPQSTGLLSVDRVDEPIDGEVVAFGNLSETQQEQFRRALEAGSSIELPLRDAEAWIGTDTVRYDNRTYEVFVAVP